MGEVVSVWPQITSLVLLVFFGGGGSGGKERETLLSLFALVSIRYATNLPFPVLLLSN